MAAVLPMVIVGTLGLVEPGGAGGSVAENGMDLTHHQAGTFIYCTAATGGNRCDSVCRG